MPCVKTVDTYVAVCGMTAAIRPNGANLLTSSMEQCLISKGHGCKEYDCEQSLVHHRGWQRHWCRHR
jgi:hypothetical protein